MSGICWWVATVDERDDLFTDLVWEEVGADGEVVASGGGARDDASLSPGAKARAAAECESVDDRLARPVPEGLGRPHPDRARQFSPFAALRGYYELVHAKEGNTACSKLSSRSSSKDSTSPQLWQMAW